jgi:hypothetical protein
MRSTGHRLTLNDDSAEEMVKSRQNNYRRKRRPRHYASERSNRLRDCLFDWLVSEIRDPEFEGRI